MISYRVSCEQDKRTIRHHWWASDGQRHLSATVLTEGDLTCFAGVYAHAPGRDPGEGPGEACRVHGRCTITALPATVGVEALDRAVGAGGMDSDLFAELHDLFVQVFAAAVL